MGMRPSDRAPTPTLPPRGGGRLNPVTGLAAAAAAVAVSLAWGGWVAAAVVVLAALAALRAGRFRRLAVAVLALAPVALSSLVINALLPAGGGGVPGSL